MRFRYCITAIFCLLCSLSVGATTIVIPADVSVLEEEAYRDREDLTEVVFAEGSRIRIIPNGAFRGCSSLRRIILPDSLERIGAHAFAYCSALEEITFPPTLKRIGNNAFSRCLNLRSVSIPDSVSELESYAFSDCISMTAARLPGNDSLLGELIFSGCESLVTLEEPSPLPPPFDCSSFIFEPEETEYYQRCRLVVPHDSEHLYNNAEGWKLFVVTDSLQ